MKLPEVKEVEPFEKRFHRVSAAAMDIMKVCKGLTQNISKNSKSYLETKTVVSHCYGQVIRVGHSYDTNHIPFIM